jgi:hypothetical protein
MSLPSYRAVEPLYIIIFRNNTQAESKFRSWIKEHRVEHAVVQGNKMMLHHQQALDRFMITWRENWDTIVIWDTWNKKHIYIN